MTKTAISLLGAGLLLYDMWKPFDKPDDVDDIRWQGLSPGVAPRGWTSVPGGWQAPGIGQSIQLYRQGGWIWQTAFIPFVLTDFNTWTLYLNGPQHVGANWWDPDSCYWYNSFTIYKGQYGLQPRPGNYFNPFQAGLHGAAVQPDFWQYPQNYTRPDIEVSPALNRPPVVDPWGVGVVVPVNEPLGPPKADWPYAKKPGRESKYKAGPIIAALLHIAGSGTEGLDFWNAVLDALGFKYVKRRDGPGWWDRAPTLGDNRFWQQWEYLKNYGLKNLDLNQLLRNLIYNYLEDLGYGKLSQLHNNSYLDMQEKYGQRPIVGIGTGPVF